MNTNDIRDYTRAELLALTPGKYLANGFVDKKGKPVPELQNTYATAASTQLLAGDLSPQELAFTYEALKQTLSLHEGAPDKKAKAALDEALETVRGMIKQPNNPGLTKWINQCATFVKSPADIEAFLAHVLAVLRLYSVMVASRQ
jgi:hypothetical protein